MVLVQLFGHRECPFPWVGLRPGTEFFDGEADDGFDCDTPGRVVETVVRSVEGGVEMGVVDWAPVAVWMPMPSRYAATVIGIHDVIDLPSRGHLVAGIGLGCLDRETELHLVGRVLTVQPYRLG